MMVVFKPIYTLPEEVNTAYILGHASVNRAPAIILMRRKENGKWYGAYSRIEYKHPQLWVDLDQAYHNLSKKFPELASMAAKKIDGGWH